MACRPHFPPRPRATWLPSGNSRCPSTHPRQLSLPAHGDARRLPPTFVARPPLPAGPRRRLSTVGAAAGGAAPPEGADRSPHECAVGVPRLALAAVRVQPNRRRHRRRAGEAASTRHRRPGPRRGERHVRADQSRGGHATRPTPRSSTSTDRARTSASTRTARNRQTHRSSPSASATPARSASPASTVAPDPSPTSRCTAATCWCSAGTTAGSSTASRRSRPTPRPTISASRPDA